MKTNGLVSAGQAIGCLIAIFSLNIFAASAADTSGELKIGEHFRVVPAADGTHEVTLVGNGLNYQDTNGNWIQSVPVVQSFPNGIVCTGASYQVILATNLNTYGSVDLELPADAAASERGRMVSHPLGIAFYDPDSGATVLLASLKDCSAQVVSNQVIYSDAFVHSNGIQGAVVYTYGVGHFHQDVMLTAKPSATPADFGMGANARLEMLTEFEQSPEPEVTENTVNSQMSSGMSATTAQVEPPAALADQTLNYGTMQMGRGRAFATAAASPLNSLTVTKQLVSVNNRNYLAEDVPWEQAAEALQNLPPPSAGMNGLPPQASVRRTMPRLQLISQLSARQPPANPKITESFKERLAAVQRPGPLELVAGYSQPIGFVMDYELVHSCTNFPFLSGHTYVISNYVQIGYVTIESGAVIKFAGGDLEPICSLNCPESEPKAVLTDINDNSVGASISNNVGHFTGSYTTYAALNLAGLDGDGAYIHNLDIRFVAYGIVGPTIEGNWCYVYDSWFFKCGQGIAGSPDFVVGPSTCDFCEVDTPFPEDFYPYDVTYCSVDRNGNGLPDDWEFSWFGNMSHTGSELDANGNTLLSDYQNFANATATNDPNIIRFSIDVTNNYVRTNFPKLSMDVSIGSAAYYSVLVDSTNFVGASWTSYTASNLMASIGSTQGWHEIWVGLKGPAPVATVTWVWKRLKLDTTAPTIAITSPPSSTVNIPMIQISGYSTEDLDTISCDVSNALGVVTNLDAGVTDRHHDTNAWEFTTNYFECLDVPLTNGVNVVRIYATDLAGNVTTLATNITLDYTGKVAPVVQLTWPQDGTMLCGSNFTIRGQVDDPTVSLMATIISTNGSTNTVYGKVERNGRFWVDSVPLNAGTNQVSIVFSNAVSRTTVTNFNVAQSAMTLTMNDVGDPMQLWQPTINLSGTISDTSAAIQVNGVIGTNNGDGTWRADNVPVPVGGVAIFDVRAIPAGEDPDISINLDKPARLYLDSYTESDGGNMSDTGPNSYQYSYTRAGFYTWNDGVGGRGELSTSLSISDASEWTMLHGNAQLSSPAASWPVTVAGTNNSSGDYLDSSPYSSTNSDTLVWGPMLLGEHWVAKSQVDENKWPVDFGLGSWGWAYANTLSGSFHRTAESVWKVQTGGRGFPGSQSVLELSASLYEMLDPLAEPLLDSSEAEQPITDYSYGDMISWFGSKASTAMSQTIPPASITVGGKQLNSAGKAWRRSSDNVVYEVTPRANGKDRYTGGPGVRQYWLIHATECTALGNPDDQRTTIGVGEVVFLWGMPEETTWKSSAGYLSPTNGNATTLTGPDIGTTVAVTGCVGDTTLSIDFGVIAPSDVQFADPPLNLRHRQSYCDAGFHAQVIILPRSVSFANIEFSELEAPVTADGCYASYNGMQHSRWTDQGGSWLHPGCDNLLPADVDYCWVQRIAPRIWPLPHFDAGNFSCSIPWNYRSIGATNDGHYFKTLVQTTTATTTGKCTISKSNRTISYEASDPDSTTDW